jgi:hypothetical protein
MSKKKDDPLTEIEMKEFVELFKQLPECTKEYFRKHTWEIFHIYFEGFHDGAQFALDYLRPSVKRLTEKP